MNNVVPSESEPVVAAADGSPFTNVPFPTAAFHPLPALMVRPEYR